MQIFKAIIIENVQISRRTEEYEDGFILTFHLLTIGQIPKLVGRYCLSYLRGSGQRIVGWDFADRNAGCLGPVERALAIYESSQMRMDPIEYLGTIFDKPILTDLK